MKNFLVPLFILSINTNVLYAASNEKVAITNGQVAIVSNNKGYFNNEGISVNPYYAVFTDGAFNFKHSHAAIGIEGTFNINKYIGITADALGKDNTDGPLVDRVGLALTTSLPLNKSFALYGQGGFGYWLGDANDEAFDMVLRVGLRYKFNKNISIFSDVGQGSRFKGENQSYQQIRIGGGLSF